MALCAAADGRRRLWLMDRGQHRPRRLRYRLTFTFKQDGAKLTGTVQGPEGDPIEISNGKVDGNKISFQVSFNGMTISHACTVTTWRRDQMSTKTDQPEFPANDLTLKRVKEGAAPAAPAAAPAAPATPHFF